MARTAQQDNVSAIRPGLPIPAQRDDDLQAIATARVAATFQQDAYRLAQTAPNSDEHRLAEHMAQISKNLPRNRLRLLVTPTAPRAEWFGLAWREVHIARTALDLIESQWLHAYHLDRFDSGRRAKALAAERTEKAAALDQAILDALRTPATKKGDVARKQVMIGKREWAAKYRPEWQAIVDEELARFPARQPRTQEGR